MIAPNGTMLGSWGDPRMGELSRTLPAVVTGGRWFVPMRAALAPDTTTLARITLATKRTDTLLRSPTIHVDSRGRAWVLVTDPARAAGDRFDLLNAQGKRIDAVRLPPQVTLVGMGRGVFYATREDGDGLLHLLRYPLP